MVDAGLLDKVADDEEAPTRTFGEFMTGANAGESKLKGIGRSLGTGAASIGGGLGGAAAGYGLGRLAQKIPRVGGKLGLLPLLMSGAGGLGAGLLTGNEANKAMGGGGIASNYSDEAW